MNGRKHSWLVKFAKLAACLVSLAVASAAAPLQIMFFAPTIQKGAVKTSEPSCLPPIYSKTSSPSKKEKENNGPLPPSNRQRLLFDIG